MSTPDLDTVLTTPAADLAARPGIVLFQLKKDATALLQTAKAIADQVDHALTLKYADLAQQQRLLAGKDTGVVHITDGSVQVTADLPKKVEWDQAQLAGIAQRISASGEDPSEFIELSYRVSETKYAAWPESIRSAFTAARTLKTGKPGFRLALSTEATP